MTKSRNLRTAFRLSRTEHDIIVWAATIRGLTVSEYVRACALERAGHDLVSLATEDNESEAS